MVVAKNRLHRVIFMNNACIKIITYLLCRGWSKNNKDGVAMESKQ